MNYTELIREIGLKTGYAQKDIKTVMESLVEVTKTTLATGDYVSVSGLGKFAVKDIPERSGVIQMGDKKGETWVKPAHKEPQFKMLKEFKNCLN